MSVEELVASCPGSVGFLRDRNIACIVCGEAVWGSLGDLLDAKGISTQGITELIHELNKLHTAET